MVRSRLASFAPSRPKMIPKASKQKPVNIETRDVITYMGVPILEAFFEGFLSFFNAFSRDSYLLLKAFLREDYIL